MDRLKLMNSLELKHKFFETPHAKKILRCIQCGACSGSCPMTDQMDHAPRELFALIRDGEMDDALRSNTIWYCVSCYHCVVRCPQEIPVIDLIYSLKQMADRQGLAPVHHKMPDLYHAFSHVVEQYGRITETMVMANYGMRHLLDAVTNIPLAVRLMKRGRIHLLPPKLIQRERIARMLSDAEQEETG